MISPHPVYTARGTPISVFNRCVALCALGHEVDLITYPIGEDVPVDGLRYVRAQAGAIDAVAVGPSWAKVPLDAAVGIRSLRQLLRHRDRYDVIHSHEEAGVLGRAYSITFGLPHIYDMGNDWGVVLQNYGLSARHPLTRLASRLEHRVVDHASSVIAHFPTIAESIRLRHSSHPPVEVVFNVALDPDPDPAAVAGARRVLSPDNRPLIAYTGTLEPYQGVSMVVEALASLVGRGKASRLLIAGGRPEQISKLRSQATRLGVAEWVSFTGVLPPEFIPACLAAADVLVSPRASGTNTPLKIFSYLRSGTPIVATAIQSHTQVLDGHNSVLVGPTPDGLAEGVGRLLDDPGLAARISAGATSSVAAYGIEAYVAGVARAYQHVGGPLVEPELIAAAADRVRTGVGSRTADAQAVSSLAGFVGPLSRSAA